MRSLSLALLLLAALAAGCGAPTLAVAPVRTAPVAATSHANVALMQALQAKFPYRTVTLFQTQAASDGSISFTAMVGDVTVRGTFVTATGVLQVTAEPSSARLSEARKAIAQLLEARHAYAAVTVTTVRELADGRFTFTASVSRDVIGGTFDPKRQTLVLN